MIVRILSEGQYRLAGAYLDELNNLDNQLVRLLAAGDEASFQRVFAEMLEQRHSEKRPAHSRPGVTSFESGRARHRAL